MAEWPLIGRGAELEVILARIRDERPGGVVLAGAPGVGKTRLAPEARETGEGWGVATVRAVASRATSSIPFGAMAPLLPPDADAAEDRLDLLRKAADGLSDRAGTMPGGRPFERRVVVVVDDAHPLDDGSAAPGAQGPAGA